MIHFYILIFRFLIFLFLLFTNFICYTQVFINGSDRILQTNIPIQTISETSAFDLCNQVYQTNATCWIINMGGIYAYYPTKLDFQVRNPYLIENSDYSGELIKCAKEKGLKIILRFDFSRFPHEIAAKHPEWLMRRTNGDSIVYNDLVASCINTDYYYSYAQRIIQEVLSIYDADGIFVNWWGNAPVDWYSQIPNGTCHCNACKKKWSEYTFKSFPENVYDSLYISFMKKCRNDAAHKMHAFIKSVSPTTDFIIYHGAEVLDNTDGFTTESRTNYQSNINWNYQSSYYTNLYRNSYPEKYMINTIVNFIDFRNRYIAHRYSVNEVRMLQTMAHGGSPAFYVIGTCMQPDRLSMEAIKYPFDFHKKHEDVFRNQKSIARIAIVNSNTCDECLKGLINMMSEMHIPFTLLHDAELLTSQERFDLVITLDEVDSNLLSQMKYGVNILSIGINPPIIYKNDILKKWTEKETQSSYWQVNNTKLFPSLKGTSVIYNSGPYTEIKSSKDSAITMILPSIYGPPELVWSDKKISTKPGIIFDNYYEGNLIYIPWNITKSYFIDANSSFLLLMADVIDYLLPQGRQIKTNAHSLIEMSLMKSTVTNKTYLHMVNLTGQLHSSNNQWIPFTNFEVSLKTKFKKAKLVDSNTPILLNYSNGYTNFKIPFLELYNVVELVE